MIYPEIEHKYYDIRSCCYPFLALALHESLYLKSWPYGREPSVGSERNIMKKTMRLICGKPRLVVSDKGK